MISGDPALYSIKVYAHPDNPAALPVSPATNSGKPATIPDDPALYSIKVYAYSDNPAALPVSPAMNSGKPATKPDDPSLYSINEYTLQGNQAAIPDSPAMILTWRGTPRLWLATHFYYTKLLMSQPKGE